MCLGLVCWSQPIFAKVENPIIFWAKDTFFNCCTNTTINLLSLKEILVAFCIFTKYVWAWSAGLQTDFAPVDRIQSSHPGRIQMYGRNLNHTVDKYPLQFRQIQSRSWADIVARVVRVQSVDGGRKRSCLAASAFCGSGRRWRWWPIFSSSCPHHPHTSPSTPPPSPCEQCSERPNSGRKVKTALAKIGRRLARDVRWQESCFFKAISEFGQVCAG